MAEPVDSLSIELTASTGSAEASIQRVIDMLRMLKAATIDASIESKIGKSIRSIAQAAKEIDSDAGQRLARLAGGLRELSKVGDLSNLANAGKNLSGVVRAVNSMGHGGNGLSNLANGIKQTADALGGIKDADVSKLNAVKDALSGEMSGSLHSSTRTSESAALGGMGSPEPSFGNMAAYGAMTVFKYTADSIRDATAAYREFRAALAGGGSTVDTQFTDSMITVFKYTADSIRDATADYREFQAALGSGVPPIFTEFVDKALPEAQSMAETVREATEAIRESGNTVPNVNASYPDWYTNPSPWRDARIKQVSNDAKEASKDVHDLGDAISDAGNRFKDWKMTPLEAFEDHTKTITDSYRSVGGESIAETIRSESDAAENASISNFNLSAALNGVSMAFRNIDSFGKRAFSVISAIPSYFGGELVKSVGDATKGFGKFLASIKRIARYRLIRTALKLITQNIGEGIKNLYHWSQTADHTFANSMNTIATASKYVGNSFAAMVSPLINAVAPAIDFIADRFVDLFNLINQIISRLSGKTSYTAAKKVAAQWQDAADNAGGSAKKAADEIKRTILGFDEINKLNAVTDNSGGSGSGGNGIAASNMFETLPIEGSVSSFADQLKAAFEESNWQEIGTLLGGKVNELVNNINFAGAGAKVGVGINSWFTTKYWTLDTINFTNIGSNIAEFLNNAIEKIDFNIIGRSMVQKLTIIGDLLIGFFTDFDWGQAATALSDFVKGLYDEFTKWFDSHNWGEIGGVLYQKLTDALANFDAEGIANSIFTALGTAVKSLIELGAGFLAWFWDDVSDWWENNIKADTFTETVHNILDAIGQGFSNIGEWVWNNIVNPFIVALTGNENWLEDFTKWGENVWNAIWNGVTTTVSNIAAFATVLWDNIVNPFITALTGNENWLDDFIDWGKSIWDGICKGITNAISSVGTWIKKNIWTPFVNWFKSIFGIASPAKTMVEPGEQIMNGVLEGILNIVSTLGDWIFDNVFSAIISALSLTSTVIDLLSQIGKTIIETVLGGILNVMGTIVGWVAEHIIGPLMDAFTKDDEEEQGEDFSSKLWNAIKSKWGDKRNLTVHLNADKTASDIWKSLKKSWNDIQNKVFSVEVDIKKGDWDATAWLAATMTQYTTTRTINTVVEKGSWDDTAWLAVNMTPYTVIRTVKAETEIGEWDATAWTAASMTAYAITRTVTAIVKKGDWDATAWTAASMTAYPITRTVTAIVKKGDWDATAWLAATMTQYTTTRTIDTVVEKGSWDDTAWLVANMTPYTVIRTVKAETEIGEWDATAWTAASMTAYAITRTVTAIVKKGDWDATAWTAALMNVYALTRTVTAIVKKGEWDATAWIAATITNNTVTRTVNVELKKKDWTTVTDFVDGNFGGATGGGGITGGGAGRTYGVDTKLNVPTKTTLTDWWNATTTYWKKLLQVGDVVGLMVALRAPGEDGMKTLASKIGEAWDALIQANKLTYGVIVQPVANKTGDILSNMGRKIGEWLFGPSTPTASVTINGDPGNGFTGKLSGTNTYTLKGIEDTSVTVSLVQGWIGTPEAELGVADMASDVSVGITKNWVGSALSVLKLKDLDSSVLMKLSKEQKWKEKGVYGRLGLENLKSNVTMGLAKNDKWKSAGSAIKYMKLDNLSTVVTVDMVVGKNTADTLGIDTTKAILGKDVRIAKTNADGGIFSNGSWHNIPQYAGGTTNAHGSLFMAGEAGPEIVGHVGGRTEVLNKSQLASAMFSAVRSAMAPASANFANAAQNMGALDGIDDMDALLDLVRRGSEATERQNELLRQQNEYLRSINDKDVSVEVTTASINKAQTRANRRAGITMIPVGT